MTSTKEHLAPHSSVPPWVGQAETWGSAGPTLLTTGRNEGKPPETDSEYPALCPCPGEHQAPHKVAGLSQHQPKTEEQCQHRGAGYRLLLPQPLQEHISTSEPGFGPWDPGMLTNKYGASTQLGKAKSPGVRLGSGIKVCLPSGMFQSESISMV